MKNLVFILTLLGNTVIAGEVKQIELVDGSIISGDIVSLSDGVYTIQSTSLGTLKLDEAQIATIHLQAKSQESTVPATAPANGTSLQNLLASQKQSENVPEMLQALQSLMVGDQDIMSTILALQEDSKIKEALADPTLVEMVKAGDIQALAANPKFTRLLEHPEIQALQKKLGTETE